MDTFKPQHRLKLPGEKYIFGCQMSTLTCVSEQGLR